MKPTALQTTDIVAIALVIGCMVLMGMGKDGPITFAFLTMVSFFFGKATARAEAVQHAIQPEKDRPK